MGREGLLVRTALDQPERPDRDDHRADRGLLPDAPRGYAALRAPRPRRDVTLRPEGGGEVEEIPQALDRGLPPFSSTPSCWSLPSW